MLTKSETRRGVTGESRTEYRQEPSYQNIAEQRTRRYKCPVHHGKNLSVAVGYIDGRVWAKCWSRGCGQEDILAALGIATSKKIWEVQKGVTGSVARMSSWPHPRPRPTINVETLRPVTAIEGVEYLTGILTPSGSEITYQRNDGLLGKHWRNPDMRRNPGVTGDGWQLRRFDPIDPAAATAICLSEGEKDAARLSAAGMIAFCGPRGASSLPSADFTELMMVAKVTGLPVLLCGDNDEPGRLAMRKVRSLLKNDFHLDATNLTGPEKGGSIADLPNLDLQALIRLKLSDRDPSWQKPIRNRAQYYQYKCPRPKRYIKSAGDGAKIWALVPCGNTATCQECAAWESFLHIERCWRGKPAQMIQVSGFGEYGSTIAATTGLAKVYREHLEGRLRKNSYVLQKQENPSSERRNFLTALALGVNDYRASLAMFLSRPLSDQQIAKERRRAEQAGLGFQVTDVVMREDIEAAAPPALTIKMEGVGNTDRTNSWTTSGWPTWWQPETTYAFSDGRELAEGEAFPTDSLSMKEWKSQYHQVWDIKKSLTDNLIQREFEFACFNAQLAVTTCHGLSLETLYGIAAGESIEAHIKEMGDYEGDPALLRDVANFVVGRREWRPCFRPVLDAVGWKE